jgi:hypothetical protein
VERADAACLAGLPLEPVRSTSHEPLVRGAPPTGRGSRPSAGRADRNRRFGKTRGECRVTKLSQGSAVLPLRRSRSTGCRSSRTSLPLLARTAKPGGSADPWGCGAGRRPSGRATDAQHWPSGSACVARKACARAFDASAGLSPGGQGRGLSLRS